MPVPMPVKLRFLMHVSGADAGQYWNVGSGDGGLSENGARAGLGAGFRPLLNMYHTKLKSTHGFSRNFSVVLSNVQGKSLIKWCPSVPAPGAGDWC